MLSVLWQSKMSYKPYFTQVTAYNFCTTICQIYGIFFIVLISQAFGYKVTEAVECKICQKNKTENDSTEIQFIITESLLS